MADAKIRLPSGATVDVTGTPEEVAKVLQLLQSRDTPGSEGPETKGGSPGAVKAKEDARRRTKRAGGARGGKTNEGDGVRGYIREMKADGFFKGTKRSLSDVRGELGARGHHYPDSSIASRLLELVQSRELGRIKEEGKWLYVHRGS